MPIEEDSLGINVNMEDDLAKKLNNEIIYKTIDNMDEPDKSIFTLRYFYFKKVKDIAIKLDLSPKKYHFII